MHHQTTIPWRWKAKNRAYGGTGGRNTEKGIYTPFT